MYNMYFLRVKQMKLVSLATFLISNISFSQSISFYYLFREEWYFGYNLYTQTQEKKSIPNLNFVRLLYIRKKVKEKIGLWFLLWTGRIIYLAKYKIALFVSCKRSVCVVFFRWLRARICVDGLCTLSLYVCVIYCLNKLRNNKITVCNSHFFLCG